jgi:hypothetical protein
MGREKMNIIRVRIKHDKNEITDNEVECLSQKIKLLINTNQFQNSAQLLGRGEFSDVYRYQAHVIKISHDISLHNPKNYTQPQFLKIANHTMQEEIDTYKLLNPNPILPRYFYSFEYQDHIYIIKEYGIIDLDEGQTGKLFPKWKTGSVKLHDYQILIDELYAIAKKVGYFDDLLQIAKREDNSLFLYDLGYFDKTEDWLIKRYDWVFTRVQNLNEQFGLSPKIPYFVIQDYIAYFQAEYDRRVIEINKTFANKTLGKELSKWRQLEKEYENEKKG